MGFFRDKVVVNKHYNETTVTEKRAPTDESVRLLKEFEEKAESKFIDRIDVKTNHFEYTLLEFARHLDIAGYKFRYFCNINGKDYTGDVTLDVHDSSDPKIPQILRKAHEDILSKFLSDIVVESVHNLDKGIL